VVACVMPFNVPAAHEAALGSKRLVTSATLIGLVLFISRFADLVADPLAGYFSDRMRSRWGRRKPFMFVATPLLVVLFVLLWHPPLGATTRVNALWALALLVAVFVLFAAYAAPYLGLLPEIARTPRQRVHLATVQGFFNLAGIAVGAIGVANLAPHYGFPNTAIVVAVVCLGCLWAACFGPAERAPEPVNGEAAHFGLIMALRRTFINRAFLTYICGYYLLWVALLLIVASTEYSAAEFLHLAQGGAGAIIAITLVAGVVCLPLANRLAQRLGTKRTFLASMLWFAIFAPWLVLIGTSRDYHFTLWEARILAALLGPAVAGLFSVPYAILADVCDADARRTGRRREAMFFGVQGTLLKGGWGLAPFIAALVLDVFGASEEHSLGLHVFGPLAGLLALVGFFIFLHFPERRDQSRE